MEHLWNSVTEPGPFCRLPASQNAETGGLQQETVLFVYSPGSQAWRRQTKSQIRLPKASGYLLAKEYSVGKGDWKKVW